MKEFNEFFTITFSFYAGTITETINLHQIERDEGDGMWYYYFRRELRGTTYGLEVFGTLDDDGDIRTSGTCYVDGKETCPIFSVNVYEDSEVTEQIDDIDIIDSD